MAECVVVRIGGDATRVVASARAAAGPALEARRESAHLTMAILLGSFDHSRLEAMLRPRLSAFAPFSVGGAGYGLFVGHQQKPVLHMALTKTPRLAALHNTVYGAAISLGVPVDGQTEPEHWRPHVTIADTGLDAVAAGEAVRRLVEDGPRHWTVRVDNLVLLDRGGTERFTIAL